MIRMAMREEDVLEVIVVEAQFGYGSQSLEPIPRVTPFNEG